MIRNKKLISIIPVRKNSTGIKNKNLLKIYGKSILERTIILSKKNKYIDKTIVSTNCKKMFRIAKKHNCNSLTLRPGKLATKYALTIDVINHVIKENNLKDCYILLLQVTSPMRNQKMTENFLNNFNRKKNYDSAASVTNFDHPHPHKVQIIKKNSLISMLNKESMVPRQKLPKVYKLNGLFYIAHSDQLLKKKTFFTKNTMPFKISEEKSLNLDNNVDLLILRDLIQKRKINK